MKACSESSRWINYEVETRLEDGKYCGRGSGRELKTVCQVAVRYRQVCAGA